jgi:hypothetical protein
MAMCRAKHLLTLTLRVCKSELLLTGFKGTLGHGEGLSLVATDNQLYGVILARNVLCADVDILSGILDV